MDLVRFIQHHQKRTVKREEFNKEVEDLLSSIKLKYNFLMEALNTDMENKMDELISAAENHEE